MHRIGVFGASFNPPTKGHEDVVNQALLHFDEILLVPSLAHPFGKTLLPIHHRLEMLRIFVEPWQEKDPSSNVKIFNVEALIETMQPQKKIIYTFDVLSELDMFYRATQMPFSLCFIVGPDNATPSVWEKFYRFKDIEKRWGIFVAKQNIPTHSTSVREIVSSSIQDNAVLKGKLIELVSEPIADYILWNNLYRDKVAFHG